MAPQFITKRLASCAGTPVHTLICGHTIHASFLHPTASSRCAPNCKDVNMATKAEPSFLCPTCYESQLRHKYNEFVNRCKEQAKNVGFSMETIVKEVKTDYENGQLGEKNEFDRWWDVFLKYTCFEKVRRESYKWESEKEGLRDCKVVDGEYEEEVEVGR
jgi:hypothetical protein